MGGAVAQAGLLPGLYELSDAAPVGAGVPSGTPGGLGWGAFGGELLPPLLLLPELPPLLLLCEGLLTFATKSAYVRSWPAIWRGMVPAAHSARATRAMFPLRFGVEPRLHAHAQQAALPPMGLQNRDPFKVWAPLFEVGIHHGIMSGAVHQHSDPLPFKHLGVERPLQDS